MVKFIRIRGRIIPIIQDAVKKGSGYFGRASKMKLHDDRINALQKVREAVSGKIPSKDLGFADVDKVFISKDKVVKRYGPWTAKNTFEHRAAAEASLHKIGLGAESFHIKTSKNKYMVQERIPFVGSSKADQNGLSNLIKRKLGLRISDLHNHNYGSVKGKIKIIDGGNSQFDDAQGFWKRDFPERTAKIRARKFIIEKPNKPRNKLTIDEFNELKAMDRFNLLGKKK